MDQPLVHPQLGGQSQKNAASRDLWQKFADHRRRVTDLLIGAIPDGPPIPAWRSSAPVTRTTSISPRLRHRFAALDLVDCDCQSVLQGIARQGLAADPAIRSVGPIDLSGIAGRPIDEALTAARTVALPIPPTHVVASVCLLSQILDDLAAAIGPTHPRYLDLLKQVRLGHFQLLLDHLVPGGTGIFITDLVSSDSAPQIVSATPLTLPRLLKDLVDQANFFTGLNPAVIHSLLTADPAIAPQITGVSISQPWLWDFGQRTYAVYAARFRRLATT